MPETAQAQAPRLVELVAWLSQSDSAKPVAYRAAAKRLGVPEATVRADIDVLLGLSSEHKDWLASLRVALVADGFAVHSLGAFRRPVHFTGEEGLALLMGLGAARGGKTVATKLAKGLRNAPPAEAVESGYAIGAAPSVELDGVLAVARRARDEKRKLEILYCGPVGEPSRRVTHVHQVVEASGRWYVIAWCEKVCDFRHFRADRVVEARMLVRISASRYCSSRSSSQASCSLPTKPCRRRSRSARRSRGGSASGIPTGGSRWMGATS